jgi:hypothetical protein
MLESQERDSQLRMEQQEMGNMREAENAMNSNLVSSGAFSGNYHTSNTND